MKADYKVFLTQLRRSATKMNLKREKQKKKKIIFMPKISTCVVDVYFCLLSRAEASSHTTAFVEAIALLRKAANVEKERA